MGMGVMFFLTNGVLAYRDLPLFLRCGQRLSIASSWQQQLATHAAACL